MSLYYIRYGRRIYGIATEFLLASMPAEWPCDFSQPSASTAAMVRNYIRFWCMGPSRHFFFKRGVYTKVMCLIHPQSTN